ncbi:MAG: hypothetical protein BWY75_01412 [bacterium ADurb.Bin425]|nr:MAG: hypothetical protein BWY75_01412 [bacterium ADurb.Bin425]
MITKAGVIGIDYRSLSKFAISQSIIAGFVQTEGFFQLLRISQSRALGSEKAKQENGK